MIFQALTQFLTDNPDLASKRLVVAYSGGRDSHVLLHALSMLYQNPPSQKGRLSAIHVNHQIHPQSAAWAKQCQKTANGLNIDCQVLTVDLHLQKGESLEAKAREARYQALSQNLEPGDVLLTAHTQDDQAETLLLQLIRGAGVMGLSAMGEKKPLGKTGYVHYRPLLNITREQIDQYSKEYHLQYIEDESNQDLRFDRNFIRHEILPKLKTRFPGVVSGLSRTAQLCQEAVLLQNEIARGDFEKIANKNHIQGAEFVKLDPKRQRNVFRYWIRQNQIVVPSKVKLSDILKQMNLAGIDSTPCVQWGAVQLRRYKQDWYLTRVSERAWGVEVEPVEELV